jgi:hypothetical protein
MSRSQYSPTPDPRALPHPTQSSLLPTAASAVRDAAASPAAPQPDPAERADCPSCTRRSRHRPAARLRIGRIVHHTVVRVLIGPHQDLQPLLRRNLHHRERQQVAAHRVPARVRRLPVRLATPGAGYCRSCTATAAAACRCPSADRSAPPHHCAHAPTGPPSAADRLRELRQITPEKMNRSSSVSSSCAYATCCGVRVCSIVCTCGSFRLVVSESCVGGRGRIVYRSSSIGST